MARGWSLHLGVNSVDPAHYAGWTGPLQACEADAQDMASIARARGFRPTVALTKKATRATLTNFLRRAAVRARPGDVVWVSYSGHGGQVPDWTGEETDNQDETWCLYDGQVIDDELWAAWSRFKAGVRILLVSDSCHSGTVARAAAAADLAGPAGRGLRSPEDTPRAMPHEAIVRTYRANRRFYDGLQAAAGGKGPADVGATVLLLSGCQDNQFSYDGTFNGAFTGQLLRTWRDGAYKGAYRDFHRAILKAMPSRQSPNYLTVGAANAAFEAQTPFTV